MRDGLAPLVILLFAAAPGCSGDEDARSDTGAASCVPGQQASCACPGGALGLQICEPDGSRFGVCMGCDGGSSGVATSSDDDTTTTTASTTTSSTGPMADESESTGTPGGSESGGGTFAWVWIDQGGPAYLPAPCAATVGVADGLLVDPQAFFGSLVEAADPNDWETVMDAIEPELWACGLGQQRGSQGNVRGRLYLPTETCPNASPPADDPEAMFLGVRQERACWAHFVDVVSEL